MLLCNIHFLWIYFSVWTVIERLQSGQLTNSLSLLFLVFSSITTTGSGTSSLIGYTVSFVILILGFAFAFALGFDLRNWFYFFFYNCSNCCFLDRFLNRLIINSLLYLVSCFVVWHFDLIYLLEQIIFKFWIITNQWLQR